MLQKPNAKQRELLRRRGFDWKDYLVAKALYGCVWFIHRKTGRVKIINKNN